MLNIGENIAYLRNRKKLTQEELAKKTSLLPQDIADYEEEIRQPDIETLVTLAESTNMNIGHLIYGFPSPNEEKKERTNIIYLIILSLLFCISSPWLEKFIQEWVRDNYDIGLKLLYSTLVIPLFSLIIGYTIVSVTKFFLGHKPLHSKYIHKLHLIIGFLLLAYFIFIAPPAFYLLKDTIGLFLARRQGIGFSSASTNGLMSIWFTTFIKVTSYSLKTPHIFIVLGAALSLTKTKSAS